MAKFLCVCGEIIQTSGPVPNPIEWLAWSDETLADLGEAVDAEKLYSIATLFFKCPRSGHLWFFWNGIVEPPVAHEPVTVGEVPAGAIPPGAVGWKVVSDEAFDEVGGAVRPDVVAGAAVGMLRSPPADRLWIAWEGPSGPVTTYLALPEGWDPLHQDDQPR